MESPTFKDPQPPEDSVSDTSNSIINTERSETPDSNKGLQDNDSVTDSPKISKPVLGKAQAKKRLMAFVNKFNALPKVQKSIDKNEILPKDLNIAKKKSTENIGDFVGSSKRVDRKMEDSSDLQDFDGHQHHQPGKKMKKRTEQKILAIDEIIREDARHKEWLAKSTSENLQLLEKFSREGHDRNRDRDRDRYFDRRSRNDQRRRKSQFDNRRDNDRRNWRGSNNQRSRRQSPLDKRGNSSLDQNVPSKKTFSERSGMIDQKTVDRKRPQSSERKDEAKTKDKKDQKISSERCQSKSTNADQQLKFKEEDKIMAKSQNEKTKDKIQTSIRPKNCSNWRDFKNRGGFVREKSLSVEPPNLPGKDIKSKTAQEYDMYLKQMLIVENNRLERSRVVASSIAEGQQKEFPPESIRVTKNSKIGPVFYCENPNASLFISRKELLEILPPERCRIIRAITENMQNPSSSLEGVDPKYRVWFERLEVARGEEPPKKTSPSESPVPRKSRWNNGDETASKPVDTVSPKELENIPNESVSPEAKSETRIPTPSTAIEGEKNIPLVEKLDRPVEENAMETNENLASEYEQFMKIVSNDTSTVATLDDCYSSDESTSKTPSPTRTESHQDLTPSKMQESTPTKIDSVDYFKEEEPFNEIEKIDKSFSKKSDETVAVDEAVKIIQKNQNRDDETQLMGENIVIKNERLSDDAISNPEDTISSKKVKQKLASSSESSDSSSSSYSENEVRKKKLKRRRKKKRAKESSTMSSSSSSDSSSDDITSRKRRKVRRKKKNKRSKLNKKRSRRESSYSDSSNTSLENNLKRRKITAEKHNKISEERRSQSMEKFQLRKIKKESEDIVEAVEVCAEDRNETVVVPSELKKQVEQVEMKMEKAESMKLKQSEKETPDKQIAEEKKIINKNLIDESTSSEIDHSEIMKSDDKVPAKKEKQDTLEMEKVAKIKEEKPEIERTEISPSIKTTPDKSEGDEKTEDPAKSPEKPSNEIVGDQLAMVTAKKSETRRRRHSSSSSSSSFTSSSMDSTSTLTTDDTKSSEKTKKKRNPEQQSSHNRHSKSKKVQKNFDKWGSQLDFDSLHSLNFPSLTQLEQRVGKNFLDDWEVDSMDGAREFAASTSRDKLKRPKKVEKEVRYDEKTDTYISVEKETPRGGRKKIPDRKCSLRIWEDEEEEGEREAILLMKGKDQESEKNLKNWLPGGERFPQVPKIEIKKKEEPIKIQPESSPEKEKTESSIWMEVLPDAIPLPEDSVAEGRTRKTRWSNVTSPTLESPKTPDTPEGSLVPVNWEEEEVVWPEPIKTHDVKQSRSKIDVDKLIAKKLESNTEVDKHDSINTEGSSVYSANSPTLSQKLDTAEPSSDSSSDSSDSSSTSESSDSEGDSANEDSQKSDDAESEMNTFSPENTSRISFTKDDSKDFLMKDTDDDSYSGSDTMKKLRMDMFRQFSTKGTSKITPKELNDATKPFVDIMSSKSPLKLIPNMLLARRPVDVLSRSPKKLGEAILAPFKVDRLPSIQSTDLKEEFDIPASDSSTTVPKLENEQPEMSPPRQVFRNTFTEITSQDSRSSLPEQRRRPSPRRDREEPRKPSSDNRGNNSNYSNTVLGLPKDLDRDRGKFDSREPRPGKSSSPRDRRRFSPDDRKFQRRSPPPRYRGRSRSGSRSWSRSRSRSPRRDDKWDRQKRRRYSDEGRDRFSRSPGRGRLGPKDRTPEKSPEKKPYDPMEMLRNVTSSMKQRENEAAERTRRLEDSNAARDESVTLDALYPSRIQPDAGTGSVFNERPYAKDSLEREIIEGPVVSTFDGPSRPRYRSRSLEKRSRDGDWDRSRESSISDRFRRERRSPGRRSRPSRLSPPRRGSPLRKRFISRSRSRSWSKSRSSSRSRSRSRSISRPRLRSRSPSPRSRTRLRAPERRRSLDRFRRTRSRSISRTRSRSRSYSPRRRRSRSLERFPDRSTSRERGRRIETIVHPSGMNPPPPEIASDPLLRDANVTAPFHYPAERIGDYPYYPRNNLTYPPRMEEAAINTGSPKRLSLDDRLELELGIKKSQEASGTSIPFNHPNFNPHMMAFPSPPPGIIPARGIAPVQPLGQIPPIRRNQPTVLQVGNVLQVVPADFNGPIVPSSTRNDTPASSPNTNNANRVLRVGNVLQVVPTTNVDWSGSGTKTPVVASVDRPPAVQYPPPSPSTLAVNPAVSIITPVPIPTAVPAPLIIPSSPHTMALPLPAIVPPISTPTPIVVVPEIKPIQVPPVPFAVYNYDAIMETRRKEKEERKKLREERRREKERRKMEKIRRRTKRIMGRTGRVQVLAEQDLALELNSDVSPIVTEEAQKIVNNEEEDDSKIVTSNEAEVVAPEVEEDEEEEEDEEAEVEEDEEDEEEEPEEEPTEALEAEENDEDEAKTAASISLEQIDTDNPEVVESTSGVDMENISASVSAIVIQPTPKKGILVAPGLWDKKLLNGDSEDGGFNHAENAEDDSLLSNDNFMVGWDIDEDKDDLENGRERNSRTPRRNRSRKAVQFADGVKPGEGTSPSGGEGDMPSPPPPASTSDQDPMEEFGKRTRNRKGSRKKPKRAKPPKTKKKVKVKIIKLKKPKITPLTAAMLDDSDEVDDRSPPPPPPGSPPPPELWPDYLSTYSATLQPAEVKSPSPSTSQEAPPPTPLPLLVPPPPLNYTIQPCNKA